MIRCIIAYCWLSVSFAVAGDQDLLSILASRNALRAFTGLLSTHPNLVDIARAGNITILAPTNQAWSAFFDNQTPATNFSSWAQLEALLSYHILSGVHTRGFVTNQTQCLQTYLTDATYTNVTGGQVVLAKLDEDEQPVFQAAVNCGARHVDGEGDLLFLGGVVQVIDKVLIPPMDSFSTIAAAPFPYTLDMLSFSVLNANFAAMMDNLTTFPDITSFITNDPNLSQIAARLKSDPASIASIINYNHIAGQVIHSGDLVNETSFMTPLGVNITVTIGKDGTTWINDAKIMRSDVLIGNGVIHVLDRWLNASHSDARPPPSAVVGGIVLETPPANTPEPRSGSQDLSMAAKAGIISGGTFVLLVIIVAIAALYRRRKSKGRRELINEPSRQLNESNRPRPYSWIHELRTTTTTPLYEVLGEDNEHMRPRVSNYENHYPTRAR